MRSKTKEGSSVKKIIQLNESTLEKLKVRKINGLKNYDEVISQLLEKEKESKTKEKEKEMRNLLSKNSINSYN